MWKRLVFVFFILTIFGGILFGQNSRRCSDMSYRDKNQVTPASLVVRKVAGQVVIRGDESTPLADACVVLFDEKNKTVVFSTITDEKGNFRIPKVRDGDYRLVVKHQYGFYCAANVPLIVESKSAEKRTLLINMASASIDECSHGSFKKTSK
jgi:hypothetical protein